MTSPCRPGTNVWCSSSDAAYATAPARAMSALLEHGAALRAVLRGRGDVRPAVRAHKARVRRLRLHRHPEALALRPRALGPPVQHEDDEVERDRQDQGERPVVEGEPVERREARGDG